MSNLGQFNLVFAKTKDLMFADMLDFSEITLQLHLVGKIGFEQKYSFCFQNCLKTKLTNKERLYFLRKEVTYFQNACFLGL